MFSGNTARILGKIGLLLPLVIILFLISDAAAQCVCKKSHRVARKKSVSYRTTARTVRPVRAYRLPAYYPPQADYSPAAANYEVRTEPRRVYVDKYDLIDDESEIVYDADYRETRRIATDYGYRDGWEDGEDAGMERDKYHPENSGDYRKATNGYEDTFGNKTVYKDAYRAAYLKGYRGGFRSIASRNTLRSARNW